MYTYSGVTIPFYVHILLLAALLAPLLLFSSTLTSSILFS
jgi:hypothetical protein